MRLVIRSVFFTLSLPGVVILLIPYIILRTSDPIPALAFLPLQILIVFCWVFFVLALLYCIRDFARYGKGTLAPVDPPKQLVVTGPYRYTRNPMYLVVFGALLSEAILFSSYGLLVYALVVFTLFHLFVINIEEPKLRSTFGASYEEYQISVPRWWITLPAYDQNAT